MNMKNQVLSIKQSQELIKLGFDVKKHASVKVIKTNSNDEYVMPLNYLEYYDAFGYDMVDEEYYTMTIGDIFNVLPTLIIVSNNLYGLKTSIHKERYNLYYLKLGGRKCIDFEEKIKLIDALFECLKWCITNGHIKVK